MDKERLRNEFSQAFYRSLEEGKIEITALPAAQLQALVRACADATFEIFDEVAAENRPKSPPTGDTEQVLWTGKSWMRLGVRYELTSQRLRIHEGIFSRSLHEIDLIHVREAKFTQNFSERLVNVGDVILVTSQAEHPEVRLENVKDPMEVRELVRQAYMAEQKRRGLVFREES